MHGSSALSQCYLGFIWDCQMFHVTNSRPFSYGPFYHLNLSQVKLKWHNKHCVNTLCFTRIEMSNLFVQVKKGSKQISLNINVVKEKSQVVRFEQRHSNTVRIVVQTIVARWRWYRKAKSMALLSGQGEWGVEQGARPKFHQPTVVCYQTARNEVPTFRSREKAVAIYFSNNYVFSVCAKQCWQENNDQLRLELAWCFSFLGFFSHLCVPPLEVFDFSVWPFSSFIAAVVTFPTFCSEARPSQDPLV